MTYLYSKTLINNSKRQTPAIITNEFYSFHNHIFLDKYKDKKSIAIPQTSQKYFVFFLLAQIFPDINMPPIFFCDDKDRTG